MCLEPIQNSICSDCLSKSVSQWIGFQNSSLKPDFQSFTTKLSDHFSTDHNPEKCIKCKHTTESAICPYCYQKEVFWWLFARSVDLSRKFSVLFNFDFLGTGYLPGIKLRRYEPVILSENSGITDVECDDCGQLVDDVREQNGVWMCESCRED